MFLLKINLMLNTQMLKISCCAEPARLLSQLIPTEHIFQGLFELTHYKTGLARRRKNGDNSNNSIFKTKYVGPGVQEQTCKNFTFHLEKYVPVEFSDVLGLYKYD